MLLKIWSLDGRVVQVLDRSKSQPMAIDASGPEVELKSGSRNRVCVRDVSWHSKVCHSVSDKDSVLT